MSMFRGPKAGKNPWQANTLEWTADSPPPHGNWPKELPTVYRGPYEYSVPDRDEDYWPQNEPAETEVASRCPRAPIATSRSTWRGCRPAASPSGG